MKSCSYISPRFSQTSSTLSVSKTKRRSLGSTNEGRAQRGVAAEAYLSARREPVRAPPAALADGEGLLGVVILNGDRLHELVRGSPVQYADRGVVALEQTFCEGVNVPALQKNVAII